MSAKAIYEASGKQLLYTHLKCEHVVPHPVAVVEENVNWNGLVNDNAWLNNTVSLKKVFIQ